MENGIDKGSIGAEAATSATNKKVDIKSLSLLQGYLDATFPGCCIMPCSADKTPKYCHKNGKWTPQIAMSKVSECFEHGALILLTGDIVVVDVDTESWVIEIERLIPAFKDTVICKTKKGKHYYFKQTENSKLSGLLDGARKLKDASGEDLPIDIKTVTSTGTKGVISIPPSPNKVWVRQLGSDNMPSTLPDEFLDFYRKHVKIAPKKAARKPKAKVKNIVFDLEEVRALVKILSPRRADGRDDWIQVGWCLHNIDADNLLIDWIEFSKKSTKYTPGECDREWGAMNGDGLQLGTLHMWAKMDNPHEYRNIVSAKVFSAIKECNGSHNSVAMIASRILQNQFVYAGDKLWYRFSGTLWEVDKDNIHMRKELSMTVHGHFMNVISHVHAAARLDDGVSITSTEHLMKVSENLAKLTCKLQDANFKDNVVKEMREFMYKDDFVNKLDSNPNLIAFTNGVWELRRGFFRPATPDDYLSMSVGYAYDHEVCEEYATRVDMYWKTLHPVADQRLYVVKGFSRHLYGDAGRNYFHIHAGFQGSAANGKSTMFDMLDCALGEYICKFGVQMLIANQRPELGKPMPEFDRYRGVRIMYCSEPKSDEVLNSGIMKDLTGGEKIMYRMCHGNTINEYRPMFKLHIMCNDPPQVDGSDSGVKRRIRKIDYIARFVPKDEVNESKHMFLMEDEFIQEVRDNDAFKMEFMRYLLDHFDYGYHFDMPDIIAKNSRVYIEENDSVFNFATEYIKKDVGSFFTLKQVKDAFKSSEHANGAKLQTLKNDLQKLLKVICEEFKKINGKTERNVFLGFKLLDPGNLVDCDLID